jgi:replicative DNA helicase
MTEPIAVRAETPAFGPAQLPRDEFFSIVAAKNTDAAGKEISPNLMRRMQHPTCLACHQAYKLKFPNKPFRIRCNGIFCEEDFTEMSEKAEIPYEEIRELYDIPFWASRHVQLPDINGDLEPFDARDYQAESLQCTARFQVDRWGRGLGKTVDGVIKEVHTATTRKNYNILVACPAKAQAQKWFDEINALIQNDPGLSASLVQTRQQPYYTFRFTNGSTINIFTTGSSSGREGDVIRSQSPRRVRIDEQDLLNPGDYNAILPLLRRYPNSEFHGSSTPTGKRETFYQMCEEFPDYRELHFPIMRHPDFSEEMESAARREARTELNYMHEFLAEFGEIEGGVFKAAYVDAAKQPYTYLQVKYDPAWKYYIGIDWNGEGTGTRLRVAGYNPATGKRRIVDAAAIDKTTMDALDQLRILNRKWHAEGVYIDAGFGYVQDELIRMMGFNSQNQDDRRLIDVRVVDFGANMITNKLVPNRGNDKYQQEQELERPTKPFMVEGAQMLVEMGDFEFADDDKLLEDQLRAYRVKTYSRHGWANTYTSKVGDHDLDAVMLALLGIELKYGLTRIPERVPSGTKILYAAGFGDAPIRASNDPHANALASSAPQNPREAAKVKGAVPSRQIPQVAQRNGGGERPAFATQDMFGSTRCYIATPGDMRPGGKVPMQTMGRGSVPSRTAMFRGAAKKDPYASTGLRGRF